MELEELVIKTENVSSQHLSNPESEEMEEEEEEAENDQITIKKKNNMSNKKEKKSGRLSVYWKKSALKYLKQSGFDKVNWPNHIKKCTESEKLENYLEDIAEFSQNNVCYEVDSPIFQQITSWLDKFQEKHFDDHCANELVTVMKLIAETEDHPPPEDCDGINFKDLYRFFGSVMNGEPTNELDYSTKQFLWECFNDLINEVNGEEGDLQLTKIMEKLKSFENENQSVVNLDVSRLNAQDQFHLGLDPLRLSDISKENLL